MADEPTGVVVSFKDMYDELRRLVEGVGKLTQELQESRKTDEDHEKRLRVIERWMYALPISIVLAVGSIVARFIP